MECEQIVNVDGVDYRVVNTNGYPELVELCEKAVFGDIVNIDGNYYIVSQSSLGHSCCLIRLVTGMRYNDELFNYANGVLINDISESTGDYVEKYNTNEAFGIMASISK